VHSNSADLQHPPFVLLPGLSAGHDQVRAIVEHARLPGELSVHLLERFLCGQVEGITVGEAHPVSRRPLRIYRATKLLGNEHQLTWLPEEVGEPSIGFVIPG
jgi:hypothetical protein